MGFLDDAIRFIENIATGGGPGQAVVQQTRQNTARSEAKAKAKTGGVAGPTTPSIGDPSAPVTQKSLSQYDPMVNQVKFAQAIQPFINSILQQAVGGMGQAAGNVNQAANQYQASMGNITSDQDIPQQIRDILGNGVADTANSARGVAQGLAQSGQATGAYGLLMSAIKAMQDQEQQNMQNEIELRKQIAVLQGGGGGGSSAVLDALLSGQSVPTGTTPTTKPPKPIK